MSSDTPSLDQLDALARAAVYKSFDWYSAEGVEAGIRHPADAAYIAAIPPALLLALIARVRDTAKLQREAWLDSARQTCPAFLKLGKCDTCESQALAKYPAAPPSPESGA